MFPNYKANTIQTIRMLEHFKLEGIDVELIFPDRKPPIENISIEEFYELENSFKISKTPHYLPFDKIKFLNRFFFIISSLLWSFYIVYKKTKNLNEDSYFMTRTNWILLFLSMKNKKIIYECHKYSKIEKLVLNFLKTKKQIILIFTNEKLRSSFKLSNNLLNNSLILPSSFDSRLFKDSTINKEKNSVIFSGNLKRFNKIREIEFLLDAFSDLRLQEYKLKIIGGPNNVADYFRNNFPSKNIFFLGNLSQKKVIEAMCNSEIGILINPPDEHSKLFTSPIKYFEYLKAKLKILSVNYDSHINLPMQNNMYYFNFGNKEEFVNELLSLSDKKFNTEATIDYFSYKERVKNILAQVARLEGLEPPTL